MQPRPIQETDPESFLWGNDPVVVNFGPPRDYEGDDIGKVDVLYGQDDANHMVVRIPYTPTADEIIELSRGGTLWLSLWCMAMPPVSVGVTDAAGNAVA